jgi:AAA15 family ATPase/GTPase
VIKSIAIKDFKSLEGFGLNLSKFNCLIGVNGAGKSTILQAIDFIAQLMNGKIDEWLVQREWTRFELNNKFQPNSYFIGLTVEYQTNNGDNVFWLSIFNRRRMLCSTEGIMVNGVEQLSVNRKQYRIAEKDYKDIAFNYQGSILSQLIDSEIPAPILEFRNYIRRIKSLELLSPILLRKRAIAL